ncbi:MAG: methyltransferase domain-containing protein [Pirellulaceae bacterium]|nr:methyltransferase domain-containing protein [Pirellulaceae bacterium]
MRDDLVSATAEEMVSLDVEHAVIERYSSASRSTEPSLCCPVKYDPKYLKVLPEELIERDYGCGDPSRWLNPGETVLDLGSGGGKICYIASQVVGPEGKVLGVDMNDDMLCLAKKFQQEIGDRIGYHNVEFFKGRIQDLSLDLDRFDAILADEPVQTAADWLKTQNRVQQLCKASPMIPSDSVDVVISNCVLNLVDLETRAQLFAEIYRVLRDGGRAVISDIVCDEAVPERLQQDASLWSGCISGAFVEVDFLKAFAEAGFYGIELVDRPDEPWATVEGIEFRSITVRAFKGKEGPCMDHRQAVIYKGPWKQVVDDDGHTLRRGEPIAVCKKTFDIYVREPYAEQIVPVPPRVAVFEPQPFDCRQDQLRRPSETKGPDFNQTELPDNCCGSDDC